MKISKNALLVASLVIMGSALAANAPKVNLQQTMLAKVNPQGLALWDITNAALDDSGNLSGAKITPADWAKLVEIGKALEDGGRMLATTNGIIAAAPGAKLQDEGGVGAATANDVQHFIDAKPAVFRSHALELQKTGAAVIEAAKKHDVKQMSALSNSLDKVCEDCHKVFWYPEQKK